MKTNNIFTLSEAKYLYNSFFIYQFDKEERRGYIRSLPATMTWYYVIDSIQKVYRMICKMEDKSRVKHLYEMLPALIDKMYGIFRKEVDKQKLKSYE